MITHDAKVGVVHRLKASTGVDCACQSKLIESNRIKSTDHFYEFNMHNIQINAYFLLKKPIFTLLLGRNGL